jgi:DNA polymerase-1
MKQPKQLVIARSPDGLEEIFAKLKRGPLAVDTETTGTQWWQRNGHRDLVGSIQFAAGDTAVFAYKGALKPAARWLGDQVKRDRELVFSNGKFDMHMMRETFGLHIPYPVHDTMVQSFLLDNRGVWGLGIWGKKPHALKSLASAYVDPDAEDHDKKLMAAIRAAGGKEKGDWLLAPEETFATYGAMDAWYSLQLHNQFMPRINHWPQPMADDWDYPSLRSLYETERWMILAFRDMEERGITVRTPFLEEWREKLGKELEQIKRTLAKLAKKELNWNSQPQMKQLLYTKRSHGGLGLYSERGSTDEVALKEMAHPFCEALLKYREVNKQYTSYAVGLLNSVADDMAIHATFKSTGARTGRTSCEHPNLQQQTRESGVRKAYIPRDGLVFRFADFSQVEMRFAGHFADEPMLIDGFINDPDFDVHTATARVMYGLLAGVEPNKRQRKFGKILNFTTLFGGGVKKVADQLRERLGLEETLQALKELRYRPGPSESPFLCLATLLKERYNNAMPNVRRATRDWAELAEDRGFVMNAFGRHRYIEHEKWYSAFNSAVQGTAGDAAKRGLVNVYKECQLNRGELALLLLIHDEIVYESEGDRRTDRRVLELMEDTKTFKVPIIASLEGSTTNWQEKEKIKLKRAA